MVALGRIGVSKPDVQAVLQTVRPYLAPIADVLRYAGGAPDEKGVPGASHEPINVSYAAEDTGEPSDTRKQE
jgi:hypothetical protein